MSSVHVWKLRDEYTTRSKTNKKQLESLQWQREGTTYVVRASCTTSTIASPALKSTFSAAVDKPLIKLPSRKMGYPQTCRPPGGSSGCLYGGFVATGGAAVATCPAGSLFPILTHTLPRSGEMSNSIMYSGTAKAPSNKCHSLKGKSNENSFGENMSEE